MKGDAPVNECEIKLRYDIIKANAGMRYVSEELSSGSGFLFLIDCSSLIHPRQSSRILDGCNSRKYRFRFSWSLLSPFSRGDVVLVIRQICHVGLFPCSITSTDI